jgi:hypothetical protein
VKLCGCVSGVQVADQLRHTSLTCGSRCRNRLQQDHAQLAARGIECVHQGVNGQKIQSLPGQQSRSQSPWKISLLSISRNSKQLRHGRAIILRMLAHRPHRPFSNRWRRCPEQPDKLRRVEPLLANPFRHRLAGRFRQVSGGEGQYLLQVCVPQLHQARMEVRCVPRAKL